VVTVTPQAALPDSAAITLSLSDDIIDRAGNPILPMTVVFQTGIGPDTTRPSVVYRSLNENQATNVPVNTRVYVWTFNEPIDPATAGPSDIYVYPHATGQVIPGATIAVSADYKTATLTLPADLQPGAWYSACAHAGVKDWANNALNETCVSFLTGSSPSTAGPQVVASSPVAGQTAVARNAWIEVLFDTPVRGTSLSGMTLTLGGSPVPFTWSWATYYTSGQAVANRALRITPSALLQPNATYTLTIAGAQDLAGNSMSGTFQAMFTTGLNYAVVNATHSAPTISADNVQTQLVNQGNVLNAEVSTAITVTFTQPVSPVSIYNGGVRLIHPGLNVLVPTTVTMSADARTVTLTPVSLLAPETNYQVQVHWCCGVYTQAGGSITNGTYYGFTTGTGDIDFEDQPDSIARATPFPTSYKGITWAGGWVHEAPYTSGYEADGVNAIWTLADGAKFTFSDRVFVGASFDRYPGSSGAIYFELYNNGVLVHSSAPYTTANTTLTFVASGYAGLVDEVRVRSLGGSMSPQGSFWIMDNILFDYPQ
jgi:hypothetical protein